MQITLIWSDPNDLDLHCVDPSGFEIYWRPNQRRSLRTGGELDVDRNAGCQAVVPDPVENVYWQNSPPRGTYKVEVRYWSGAECSTNAGPTPLTLSISSGGRIIGAYNYTIVPEQTISIANFQL